MLYRGTLYAMFKCYVSAFCWLRRLAVLKRWLPYTVTILDRFHNTALIYRLGGKSGNLGNNDISTHTKGVLHRVSNSSINMAATMFCSHFPQ